VRLSLRERVRVLLEELYWKIYDLLHPEFRCFDRCMNECYGRECVEVDKLLDEGAINILEWGDRHNACVIKCEDHCIKKCFR